MDRMVHSIYGEPWRVGILLLKKSSKILSQNLKDANVREGLSAQSG